MATMYTSDADFALTQTTIQNSIANGTWVRPIIDESVGLNLVILIPFINLNRMLTFIIGSYTGASYIYTVSDVY